MDGWKEGGEYVGFPTRPSVSEWFGACCWGVVCLFSVFGIMGWVECRPEVSAFK